MSTTPTTPQALVYEMFNTYLLAVAPVETVISWPGVDFEVPDDRAYLKVQFMPNLTERITINSDGHQRYLGIYQVTVVREQAVGIIGAQEAAGLVASWFPADQKLRSGEIAVRFTQDADVAMSMPDGADLLTPVTVQYETFF